MILLCTPNQKYYAIDYMNKKGNIDDAFTPKKAQNQDTSKWRKRFSEKYSGLAEDRLHKISRTIINNLSHRGVSTIIVGKNTGQKIDNTCRKFCELFFSNTLKRINADVNFSFQIMKKVYDDFAYNNSVKYASLSVKTIC